MGHYISAATFNGLIAILAGTTSVVAGVVCVKASFKARCRARTGFENHGADKGRRVVSVLAKEVGGIRQIVGKRNSEVVHLVELRIGAGENRSVRGRSQWYLGVGAREYDRLASQNVEVRSQPTCGTKESHPVGTNRVQSNQNHIRAGLRRNGCSSGN